LVAAYGITRLEVENRFIDYFHKDTEIYQGMSVIDKQLGGTISLDIILDKAKAPAESSSDSEGEDTVAEEDPFGFDEEDPFAESESDDFADEEDPFGAGDPFAEEGNGNTQESAWFNTVGLETVTELHHYL